MMISKYELLQQLKIPREEYTPEAVKQKLLELGIINQQGYISPEHKDKFTTIKKGKPVVGDSKE